MSDSVTRHQGAVSRRQREEITGGSGATVWITGLSGSGKSTIAFELERQLIAKDRAAYVLDGDNVRFGLNSDLGFTSADRQENVRRLSEVARLMADAGLIAIVPAISPYREGRRAARKTHDEAGLRFVEVYVDTPIEVCEARDPKGLYAKARAGEIAEFTGIDAPYEPPESPDIRIDGSSDAVSEAATGVLELLEQR